MSQLGVLAAMWMGRPRLVTVVMAWLWWRRGSSRSAVWRGAGVGALLKQYLRVARNTEVRPFLLRREESYRSALTILRKVV